MRRRIGGRVQANADLVAATPLYDAGQMAEFVALDRNFLAGLRIDIEIELETNSGF